MASCSDLTKLSLPMDCQPIIKVTPVAVSASKKFVEPFHRLKNRANLFRRKLYSSQLDISNHSSLHSINHSNLSDQIITIDNNNKGNNNNNVILKRSNSMICPQQRLQTFLKTNNNNNNNNRNSICIELSGCPIDESSTDDYYSIKSSSNHYWNKKLHSTMSNIKEQDTYPSNESLNENKIETVLSSHNNNNEQTSVILSSPQLTKDVSRSEQKQQLVPSVTSSSSTIMSRNNNETIQLCRQSHSNISFREKRQSTCSSFDEPFYDCKQDTSSLKSIQNLDMSTSKMSTCTMTGKSLNNLDECLSIMSSEDKCVQTTFNDSITINSCMIRNTSSTSLSSSTTSIQTDSLENKPKLSTLSKINETSQHSINQRLIESYYKWPHIYERLLSEQTCIYWVNYLGSTAIKISNDDTSTIPTHAINRLKQSTQYARVLPIIGLSISPRGVEFLKHSKDRVVICFHDIKSIHCACQDQDLRYFGYVTHEQRSINGISYTTTTFDHKQPLTSSPSLSTNGDYHNYCHVFVVKNESMSTEILLTFGQAFDIAYRLHRRLNSKQICSDKSHRNIDVSRLSTKSNKVISSSTHSPATSSSSSLSNDERRIFI
ncbi:unnamed protein product [Rotaria sp. Silwood1]|nr:unnamed protein product [Rotaria sp. Silwood1]CAF3598350.1 unnamed protein product [Rotaria sp. Silwood1]CAF3644882.1 unnamed protein product [Rotaria sp. Silwood1]CAF4768529.1 unnamed protein product [Rotaria sp. Silwood1]CAF4768673.1 unnamed protein product [Rotaria sp. Silwood1]